MPPSTSPTLMGKSSQAMGASAVAFITTAVRSSGMPSDRANTAWCTGAQSVVVGITLTRVPLTTGKKSVGLTVGEGGEGKIIARTPHLGNQQRASASVKVGNVTWCNPDYGQTVGGLTIGESGEGDHGGALGGRQAEVGNDELGGVARTVHVTLAGGSLRASA